MKFTTIPTVHICYSLLVILGISCICECYSQCKSLLDSGDIAYNKFDNRRALEYFTKAYKTCPESYETLFKMTRAQIDYGEDIGGKDGIASVKSGFKSTDTMLKRYPDSMQTHFLRALASGLLARRAKGKAKVTYAKTVYNESVKAIQLDSTFAPAYVVLGGYYHDVATASNAEKSIAKMFYGTIPEGTLQDSEKMLTKAITLEPDNINAHFELARTYLSMSEKQKAKEQLTIVQTLPIKFHRDAKLKEQAEKMEKKTK